MEREQAIDILRRLGDPLQEAPRSAVGIYHLTITTGRGRQRIALHALTADHAIAIARKLRPGCTVLDIRRKEAS